MDTHRYVSCLYIRYYSSLPVFFSSDFLVIPLWLLDKVLGGNSTPRISDEQIENLKQITDLVAVIKDRVGHVFHVIREVWRCAVPNSTSLHPGYLATLTRGQPVRPACGFRQAITGGAVQYIIDGCLQIDAMPHGNI